MRVLPRGDDVLAVQVLDEAEQACFGGPEQGEGEGRQGNWRDFVAGMLALDAGWQASRPPGLELVVSGDLAGGGLSSSASFTLALALALMTHGWLRPRQGHELARFAQAVEVEKVGTQCGLMDQLAIVHGSSASAVAIDCGRATVSPVDTDWQDRELLVMHCGQPRRLAEAAYNQRRLELSRGLAALGASQDAIPALSTATVVAQLGAGIEARRVRHGVSEQQRVLTALRALEAQDWSALGRAMTASHASLRDDFEVSVPALDALVDAACHTAGCDGARMTGAGFGGWAIALIQRASRQAVLHAAAQAIDCTPTTLRHFTAVPGGAARVLELDG